MKQNKKIIKEKNGNSTEISFFYWKECLTWNATGAHKEAAKTFPPVFKQWVNEKWINNPWANLYENSLDCQWIATGPTSPRSGSPWRLRRLWLLGAHTSRFDNASNLSSVVSVFVSSLVTDS